MSPEFILQLVIGAGSCLAVYVGIRADLARLNERANRAIETADTAHRRIDALMRRATD